MIASRFRSEPVDPLVSRDRLAGVGIGPHRRPITFGLDLLVRHRAFQDEHERLELARGGVEPILHEVVADFIGEHRIVQMHFGQAGNVAHDHVLDARQDAAVIETESPSQLRPVVIQTTWISFTSGGRSIWIISGAFILCDCSMQP